MDQTNTVSRIHIGAPLHGVELPVGAAAPSLPGEMLQPPGCTIYQLPAAEQTKPGTILYAAWHDVKLTRNTPDGTQTRTFRVLNGLALDDALAKTLAAPEHFWK